MKPNYVDYFEWDFHTWSIAIKCWDNHFKLNPLNPNSIALEIGGRRGGLSLYLAYEKSLQTICTDLFSPKDLAQNLHIKYGVNNHVSYEAQNCLDLKYPDSSFDVIIFKSVLGALGSIENQRIAISEIYRCLKPGGVLLFAENAKSTSLHNFFRKLFNNWSAKYWHYPSLGEINSLLSGFSQVEIYTNGFIATFFRNKYLKMIAELLDIFLVRVTPQDFHYVFYGKAVK